MSREFLKAYFLAPFRLIGWFWTTFHSNRQRLTEFLNRPRVKSAFQALVATTAISWVIIWIAADDQHRDRLTEAAKGFFQWGQEVSDKAGEAPPATSD
ncbi:MAG: hypothetical protein AAF530_15665 [Pseudomonadota bacterium]